MITKLELVRGSVTVDISDEINFQHEENSGFGMPPLHRLNERGPLQHGVSDRGYRLDPRVIQLVIPMITDGWEDHYQRRSTLLDVLNPVYDNVVYLRFTLPDSSIRQLDCFCTGGPLFSTRDQIAGGSNMRAGFVLYSPDPAWYDPDRKTLAISGAGGSGFVVPIVIPASFGSSSFDFSQAINYTGSWIEFPEIQIDGPIVDAIITNQTTGEVLDFTGLSLAVGESRIIDLRYGYKTVVDETGANAITDLTTGSDLATWHLVPGLNSIQTSGSGANSETKITIRYFLRYIGV